MRRVLLPHHISPDPAPAGGVIVALDGLTMGTSWAVRMVAPSASSAGLKRGLQQRLDDVVAQMSHWDASSDLGRYNRAPADSWHALAPDFFTVLDFALDVMRDSGGAYDPCAGALVNLWGFGPEQRYDEPGFIAPTQAQIGAVRDRRASQRIELDRAARRFYQPGGVQLDLSAIAKGYGVDQLAGYLESQGIHHYLVEVGGELRGAGVKPDGQPWWVALEQPPHCHRTMRSTTNLCWRCMVCRSPHRATTGAISNTTGGVSRTPSIRAAACRRRTIWPR